ncbi:hypothetical protein SPI_05661 [Niveomyces insectorum RCEF 264]|uniref:Uncharacterized protein n=1 Tax=Niveomyces insectorum RCEF 264 TaxID=1081102 RepID=A0A167TF03_9HYPO|nr:hypothetical protein SPI_05661 [Niveomyces insectorum RCEF 264]
MVVSSAPQLRSTYLLWRRFVMPVDGGQRDAVAVPAYVANQLSSAYTIMVTAMVVNAWCICFALGFFYIMRHNNDLGQLSSSLWNKRSSMADSLLSLLSKRMEHWKRWWVYPAIVIIVVCWAAQTALSILVPPLIFIDTAAPVNVRAVIVPPNTGNTSSDDAQLFALDVPAALRAAGDALVASSDEAGRVAVTKTDLGTTANFEPIQRIAYSYDVTGTELGLQHYATLQLTVRGACTTEYGWLVSSDNSSGYTNDTYAVFGDGDANGYISLSLYDGPSPVAFFYNGGDGVGLGNTTWAAFVSSVDRVSFTESSDALYYTNTNADVDTLGAGSHLGGTDYIVQPGRPVLSCWETDVWSYKGHNSTVVGLNATALPGLDLPLPLQLIFARYLGAPRIASVGQQLGLSALLSSTTALGTIFDAGSSSAFTDLRRLALAGYIATANTLTDTTLYASYLGSQTSAGNLIYDDGDDEPMDGAGDFVVWSPDVSTISIRAAIIIPVVSLASYLLVLLTINFTPLSSVNSLDVMELQKNIYEKYPDANLTMYDERTWNVNLRLPMAERLSRRISWNRAANRNKPLEQAGFRGHQPPAPYQDVNNGAGAKAATAAVVAATEVQPVNGQHNGQHNGQQNGQLNNQPKDSQQSSVAPEEV